MLLDGRAQATGIKQRGSDVTLLIVFNAHHDVVSFSLPRCYEAGGWNRLIDTNDPALSPRKFRVGANPALSCSRVGGAGRNHGSPMLQRTLQGPNSASVLPQRQKTPVVSGKAIRPSARLASRMRRRAPARQTTRTARSPRTSPSPPLSIFGRGGRTCSWRAASAAR